MDTFLIPYSYLREYQIFTVILQYKISKYMLLFSIFRRAFKTMESEQKVNLKLVNSYPVEA